jgi:para-nitrobenzyl esterase
MAGYWTRFAKTGDPNGGGAFVWPEYRKNHEAQIVFDTGLSQYQDPDEGVCAFWSLFFFRSMLGEYPANF